MRIFPIEGLGPKGVVIVGKIKILSHVHLAWLSEWRCKDKLEVGRGDELTSRVNDASVFSAKCSSCHLWVIFISIMDLNDAHELLYLFSYATEAWNQHEGPKASLSRSRSPVQRYSDSNKQRYGFLSKREDHLPWRSKVPSRKLLEVLKMVLSTAWHELEWEGIQKKGAGSIEIRLEG